MKILTVLAFVVLLCGCSRVDTNPNRGNTIIDWVDFVKLNGHSYTGSWESVIKNPNDVTNQVVGEVKFKVADVVTNPGYRTKDGDAAFLTKGTKLYRVEGFKTNEIIAVKDEKSIGGYRLYTEDGFANKVPHHYKNLPKDKVQKVELYHQLDVNPFKTLYDADKKRFIQLLDGGKDMQNYTPQHKDGDPKYYNMVFYTDEPIAYAFTLADDGANVFFSPWDTRIVDKEIRTLIAQTHTPGEVTYPTETPKQTETSKPNVVGVQDFTSDCSKVQIPSNVERDTSLDEEKGLLTVRWFDDSKGQDVGVVFRYKDQNCSESAKQLVQHVLDSEKRSAK